jgi:DNA-binding transcriptional MocR family regulator
MSFQAMTWAVEQQLPALQKLVLLMLANRTNSDTGQCNPSHDRLAADCGMHKDSVKRAIAVLADKGLLEIQHRSQEGISLPNQYLLKMGGVGAHSTPGGCSQHPRVGAHSTTKQEVKPVKETKTRAPRFDAQAHLESLSVDPSIARDWLELRKAKKLPVTETAVKGVTREAEKAQMSMDEALRTCCERGWGGFNAKWLEDSQSTSKTDFKPMGNYL